MKLKDHLIRILLIFAGLAVPSVISTAISLSGYLLGGFGTLILYAPFLCFIYCVYTGKVGPKLPPKTTDDSVPITPEMLAFSADNKSPIEDDEDCSLKIESTKFTQTSSNSGSTSDETPIGYIPSSSRAHIPWYRSGMVMSRFAIFLIGATIVFAIIYAAVSSFSTPALSGASVSQPPAITTRPVSTPAVTQDVENSLSIEERLDRLKQAGEFSKNTGESPAALPTPYTGAILYENPDYTEWHCPLTVDASFSRLSSDFYIQLRNPKTEEVVVSFYVRKNSSVTVDVPPGIFEFVYASGSIWYGENLLFGSDTKYFQIDNLLDFYTENGWDAVGWNIEVVFTSERICGKMMLWKKKDVSRIPAT